MNTLATIAVALVILVLCGLGLSVGLLCGRKGLRKCGQGETGGCAMCGGDESKCDRREEKTDDR